MFSISVLYVHIKRTAIKNSDKYHEYERAKVGDYTEAVIMGLLVGLFGCMSILHTAMII